MNGILAINHYLTGKKYSELHSHLVKSAAKKGIELEICTNCDIMFMRSKPQFALFWDKDTAAARLLEKRGVPVFNSARAIELCDNKALTYLELLNAVPQPETYFSPLSFSDETHADFVGRAVRRLGFPLVFKECFGSFGEQVFLCRSEEDVFSHISSKPFLLQKYIPSGNSDIRIEVVGGKCIAAVRRTNNADFRSNLTLGGTARAYTPTAEQARLAAKACSELGLAFGGVDIIGENMVCEVNSNAHIMNLLRCTGTDAADAIFDLIKSKI